MKAYQVRATHVPTGTSKEGTVLSVAELWHTSDTVLAVQTILTGVKHVLTSYIADSNETKIRIEYSKAGETNPTMIFEAVVFEIQPTEPVVDVPDTQLSQADDVYAEVLKKMKGSGPVH